MNSKFKSHKVMFSRLAVSSNKMKRNIVCYPIAVQFICECWHGMGADPPPNERANERTKSDDLNEKSDDLRKQCENCRENVIISL